MQNKASVEIDCPIDRVFELTIGHVAEWSRIVTEDELVSQGPVDVGTEFRTVTEDRGQRMEFRGFVTRHEPPHRHTVDLLGDMFRLEADYHFEDLGGRTRVTQRATAKGKGFVRIMMTLFGWLMSRAHCKATENELQSLKAFCEARRT